MSELGPPSPPTIEKSYPHMLWQDTAVWSDFLAKWGSSIDGVWYDVHVGQAMALPAGPDSMLTRVSMGVSRKRIDAVLLWHDRYTVVEIKPYANHVAYGQVLLYKKHFRAEFPECRTATAAIAAASVDPDVQPLINEAGIQLFLTGSTFGVTDNTDPSQSP